MIEVRGVSKTFATRTVLDDVELTFAAGAVTALLGPNGAGKTTLLKSILGLVRPTRGTVWVAGSPIDDAGVYPTDARRCGNTVIVTGMLVLSISLRSSPLASAAIMPPPA